MQKRRAIAVTCLLVTIAVPGWAQLRQEKDMNGEWEYVRVDELARPPAEGWQPIRVPGMLRGVRYERAWFRTRFTIPQSMEGRQLKIHFGGVKFNSIILLNGQQVGGCFGGYRPFEVDITDAAKTGQKNTLAVGCRDWTGVFIDDETDFSIMNERPVRSRSIPKDKILAPIGGHNELFGPWDDVTLLAHPANHIDDVFIKPSVRQEKLTVECGVEIGQSEIKEAVIGLQVLDGQQTVIDVAEGGRVQAAADKPQIITIPWDDAHLWSPTDPHLYILRLTLKTPDGDVLDELRRRFGFREFWIDGKNYYLNGKRINLLATSWWPSRQAESEKKIRRQIRRMKEANCVAFRTHTQPWRKIWYETADEMGMLMIPEGAIWNDDTVYRIGDPTFWDNYAAHLKGMVENLKNHPSVIMYSLENEMYGSEMNDDAEAKQDLIRMGKLMHRWDPTRPIYYESDADPGGVADAIGIHYPHEYPEYTKWPNTAYWLDTPEKTGHQFLNGDEAFVWERKKPLYIGEYLWIGSSDPSWHTVFFGDKAYRDYRSHAQRAKAMSWRMATQAYRYYEVGGMSPWLIGGGSAKSEAGSPTFKAQKYAMQHIAAYIREYDHNFYSGENVDRTADVYNDVLHPSELTLSWSLQLAGERLCGGHKDLRMEAGERTAVTLDLQMPNVEKRRELTLRLAISRSGESVFEDSKAYSVFPRLQLNRPRDVVIGLYDPDGGTRQRLSEYGLTDLVSVGDLEAIDRSVDVLVIGAGALEQLSLGPPTIGATESSKRTLMEFVKSGGRMLVLEHQQYPEGALPVSVMSHNSTMTFPQMPGHPILSGVRERDLKWWRPDNIVTSPEPKRPRDKAFRAIVVSGSASGIAHAPLLELPRGQGTIIVSQLKLAGRLGIEPAAGVILQNAIDYLAKFEPHRSDTALYCGDERTRRYLENLGLRFTDVSEPAQDIDWSRFDLCIVCGPLEEPAGAVENLMRFVGEGGGDLLLYEVDAGTWQRLERTLKTGLQMTQQSAAVSRIPGAHELSEYFANEDLYWLGEAKAAHSWATRPRVANANSILSKTLNTERASVYPHTEMTVSGAHAEAMGDYASLPSGGRTASVEVDIPTDGQYIVGIRAAGTQAQDVWPRGRVTVDGKSVGTFSCTGREFGTFTVFGDLPAGSHDLAVRFTNDLYNPPEEDRNLWIKAMMIAPADPAPGVTFLTQPPAVAVIERGKGRVIVDNVGWEAAASHGTKASRYICGLLTGLGARFKAMDATVLEAETFDHDPQMSWYRRKGDAAYLGDDGYIETRVNCEQDGDYRFDIVARGTPVDSVYPIIDVGINGKHIGSVELEANNWMRYTLPVTLERGKIRIRLSFTNDEHSPPEDRNLMIDRIEIAPSGK